ncbi:MAG: hypothetical protein QGH77_04170, partial [Planctomycetota bacterium]|nr:hypothetical protein [Planctomycetota bacterium]
MSDEKIKVFKLAKQYGFKSADFVGVLKKVGFPVTSYQASLDAWDVPIIEERLLKGGLIEASQATAIESPEATEEEGDGWNIVVEPAPETPEVEAEEPIEEEVETPEPVEDEIVAEGEESTPGETEGESKPAEEDEPEPQEAVTDP